MLISNWAAFSIEKVCTRFATVAYSTPFLCGQSQKRPSSLAWPQIFGCYYEFIYFSLSPKVLLDTDYCTSDMNFGKMFANVSILNTALGSVSLQTKPINIDTINTQKERNGGRELVTFSVCRSHTNIWRVTRPVDRRKDICGTQVGYKL